MNLDELKTAWQTLDRKLAATKTLNEKLIISMVTERSSSRFRTVKRNYLMGFAWLTLSLLAGLAVLLGNPFDFQYTLQYIPIVIYCIGLSIFAAWMILSYLKLGQVRLDQANIKSALQEIVAIYERPKKIYILWMFLFSQVVLFPLSFLPKGIERVGLWAALGELLIPMSVTAALVFVAHRLGVFREKDGDRFKADLKELEQLKKMAEELENA
jgi:hypothetical protein